MQSTMLHVRIEERAHQISFNLISFDRLSFTQYLCVHHTVLGYEKQAYRNQMYILLSWSDT